PFKEAEFDIMYGYGISREGDILDIGSSLNIISRSGTWFSWGDIRLGQGRENAKAFLRENPDIAAQIEAEVRRAVGLDASIVSAGTSRASDNGQADDAAAQAAAPSGRA